MNEWVRAAGWLVAGVLVLLLIAVRARGSRRTPGRSGSAHSAGVPAGVLAALVSVAVVAAAAVALLGGVRSFDALSARFGSPAVPLTADGMIVACTALRLAALAQGWRLPGSLLVTYVFIAGTVWLNLDAAHSGTDKIAHALAPLSYAVLVEMLAHLLRLHLRLAAPTGSRVTALTWVTSPVISTQVWLHMARTGGEDPAAARVLVQQATRMASRLETVCPGGRWLHSPARTARSAAVQAVRDGLIGAADLAALLPPAGQTLTPGSLLARLDDAVVSAAGVPAAVSPGVPVDRVPDTPAAELAAVVPARSGHGARTDAELLALLAGRDAPVGIRAAARELGCGVNRARRLLAQAGLLARPNDTQPPPERLSTEDTRSLHLVQNTTTKTDQ